ncbi:MAG: SH3 domain-containing protein [Caldilineaceae bacterium]
MKQLILFLFAVLLAFPLNRTVSAAEAQQRNTPTPTPAPEKIVSGGFGTAVELEQPTFYWLETDYLSALLPTAWPNQETEFDETEGTFTLIAAADEETAGIDEQGALVLIQAADEPIDADEVLDSFELPSADCSGGERSEATHAFAGNTYASVYDMWTSCPQEESSLYVLVTQSEDVDAVLFAVFFAPEDVAALHFEIFRNTINVVDVPALEAPVRPSTPPSSRPTPTPAAEEETPTPQTEEQTVSEDGAATVVADRLNVRSGPSTDFARVSAVERGDVLTILGRNAACSWLKVTTPDGVEGWVAAGSQYVRFEVTCSDIDEIAAPPTPTPPPATATPIPAAGPSTPQALRPPTTWASILRWAVIFFENQLGAELTITFTRRSDSWNTTFRVPRSESVVQCFAPGTYTYTIDEPPPWNSINDEMRVDAGDRFLFPVGARD